MILEFFRFELREQLRSPLLWLLAVLFALLAFGAGASDAVQIGGGIGNVDRNAPVVIARLLVAFTLIGMLIITIFISSALLRDFEQGTAELFFASPIRKRDYLAGRLGAALAASLIVYFVIGLGLFVAQFMPWIDPERLGPVSLAPYLWSFAVFVIPNLLFTGALLALLAVVTRSILWVYIGVIGFFVLYAVSVSLLGDLDSVWIGTLLEPLGVRALSRTIRYWSADERNTGLPAMAGYLLANRSLWAVIAAAMFAATFAMFRTERSGSRGRRWGRKEAPMAGAGTGRPAMVRVPRVTPAFHSRTLRGQFLQQLRFDTLGVFRSVPFLVMLAFAMANFIPTALTQSSLYETTVYPVTSQMLSALQQSYSFLLVIIVLFYAGELMWKERGAKIHEVTDAMPVPGWVPLAAKFTALVAVILSFQALGGLTAVAIQLAKGYTAIEPLVYIKTLALDSLAYVLMGGMALTLQVFTNNKFIGYALLILVLVAQGVLGMLDFTHNLYTFGSWPNAPYSDMNGYGHFLVGQLAFQGYWLLLLAGLLLLAVALQVRGVGAGWRQRLSLARQRLRGPLGAATGLAFVAFAVVGGVLFWNTNVRNEFLSPDQQLDLQARYEREYRQYKDLPQPKIRAVSAHVDLQPETRSVRVRGEYRVQNPHAQPIRDLHVAMFDDALLKGIELGGAELVHHDKPAGYRIYRLAQPLLPGAERLITFELEQAPTGITNGVAQQSIVANGTFFNNSLFPRFGYSENVQIEDRNERSKRGLGEPLHMADRDDPVARQVNDMGDDADWIDFSTTVCTAPDQVALAPGYLQREFTRDGRRCFSYAMDRPMLNFFAYLSARWELRKGIYRGSSGEVPIEIYHDPKHPYNVDRMIESVQKSLSYFEAGFTPYQHRQVRIMEFPRYQSFAQSFAGTIPYSESIGFIADLRDKDAIDYVFYVTAHEIAHQWWGHQVLSANVQGATMLVESLAQYSALMVMEKEYGRAKMRRFLKHELDRYLSDRGGERVEEQPLAKVEGQPYIHYRKGSLVFYRLREEIGEVALNRALQKFLRDKAYQSPPYTTSAELLDYIRAESRPDQHGLIADLFEKISFYDNRVEAVTAKKRSDGRYDVTFDLHAAKRYADGKGKETAGQLDDWIDIGVFARGPSGKEADEKVLYLKRHHVTSPNPVITVVVDEAPHEAGFDPYNKLIDRVSSDNRKRVTL